jgi:hypothetical protein
MIARRPRLVALLGYGLVFLSPWAAVACLIVAIRDIFRAEIASAALAIGIGLVALALCALAVIVTAAARAPARAQEDGTESGTPPRPRQGVSAALNE